MQYMGGKSRIAKYLAPIVNAARAPGACIWEPFCGGLNMTVALGGPILASDAHQALITLYRAIQAGTFDLEYYTRAENSITREQYHAAKRLPDTDPLKAFVGFGVSFGGRYFKGYAAGLQSKSPYTYTQSTAASLRKKFSKLSECEFSREPFGERHWQGVIYCDPPYRGTQGYGVPFDHDVFVRQVAAYVGAGCTVFVSEQSFPLGEIVWERVQSRGLASGTHGTTYAVERLYRVVP